MCLSVTSGTLLFYKKLITFVYLVADIIFVVCGSTYYNLYYSNPSMCSNAANVVLTTLVFTSINVALWLHAIMTKDYAHDTKRICDVIGIITAIAFSILCLITDNYCDQRETPLWTFFIVTKIYSIIKTLLLSPLVFTCVISM